MQTKKLFRKEWKYGFRFPTLTFGGETVRPQGLCFMDANTLLVTGHYNETLSRCYKIDLTTKTVAGTFDFSASHKHIGSIAYRASDTSYWFGDFFSGKLLKVDLTASFAGGTASVTSEYTCTAINGFAAIEWINISGTDYLLAAEHLTSGTPYLYVIDAVHVTNGGTFATGDRLKRFVITQRCQGISFESSKLFMSMNRLTADSTATGKLQRYDLLTAISSGADGDTLAAEATWNAPSQYPQDIDFHPSSGEIWTQTEGLATVISDSGWLAAWHRSLSSDYAENHVSLEYNGGGTTTIKLNGQLFEAMAWTPTIGPACISVGGPPQAAAGQANGFFIGAVRNVFLQDQSISSTTYANVIAGTTYEPNTLTAYTVSLTNGDAESTTTGWTNEVGSISNRASNPAPHGGASYFAGGSNLQTISRQRHVLTTVTGLTTGQIDAAVMWARINWWQAGFGGTDTDTCAMGLRCLDGTPTEQNIAYAGIIQMAPSLTWFKRGFAASIPVGCRNVDALYRSDRGSGTNNDGYVDDIEMVIYKQ